jgi:hypothetical protein
MMRWQPVNKVACSCGKATCAKCVRVEYSDGIGSDTLWYTREDGREEMMYLPDGAALCRQVPDESVSVPVTYAQLILIQEAMRFAWEGFKLRPQYDQTAIRMQKLDNWIGEMLTQMKGEATDVDE